MNNGSTFQLQVYECADAGRRFFMPKMTQNYKNYSAHIMKRISLPMIIIVNSKVLFP